MIKRFTILPALLLAALLISPPQALADSLAVGVGVGWSSSPYKDHESTGLPLPIIDYEGDQFYVHGASAGYYLWQSGAHSVSLGVAYDPLEFDKKKTDDLQLKLLDDRNPTLNGFLRYNLSADFGRTGLTLYHDIFGNSMAASGEGYFKHPMELGFATITPGFGVKWDSAKQLQYYYGVTGTESARSGLRAYKPNDGFSPFLTLEAGWDLTENISLAAGTKATFLSGEITDSPMVDRDYTFSVGAGITYRFQGQ